MSGPQTQPRIMGILNITPDSFSDGGEFLNFDKAIQHGMDMASSGADIIDVGGESSRPGSERIPSKVQIQRVIPVIEALKDQLPPRTIISIDTSQSDVAEAAIRAGATLINDISAGRDDAGMFTLAAEHNMPIVLMHMQGSPKDMQINPDYDDVISESKAFLMERVDKAVSSGIKASNIIIDPGIGFGKTLFHNLEIITHLKDYVQSGYPVLLGSSRKRFLQTIINSEDKADLALATSMLTALGVFAGVQMFRVHDVRQNRETADLIHGILNGSE